MLCTGKRKTGKTNFCNLLMNKTTQSPSSGDSHSVFVKKHDETDWREIDFKHLNELIDQINQRHSVSNAKHTGTNEVLDILILLDIDVPVPTICLLQPAMVTFVTYRLRGEEDAVCTRTQKFIKEIMSSNCFGKKSGFDELEIGGTNEKSSYIAFIGTFLNDGRNSEDAYRKEATVVSKHLNSLKRHINCSLHGFPLELWYEDDGDCYLHVVDLQNNKDKNVCFIKQKLEKTLAENATHKIPVSWVLLCFKVQRVCYEQKVQHVSYNTVFKKIWKTECKMQSESELNLALKFFHHQGVLFHFSTVEEAKDYVFIRCCWMFDKLKYLLGDFKDEKRNHASKQLLKKEGILDSKMIRDIDFEGPVTFKAFVHLLLHLKFIAPVKQNEYFIPSILESYESNKGIFEEYGTAYYEPLLITFSSGSLHRSVFCFISAYILTNMPEGWGPLYYDEKVEQQHTFKDMITFSIGVKKYVCIIDKTFSLRIQIFTKTGHCDRSLPSSIFETIKEALMAVCRDLEVPFEICKYGFLCSNERCQTDEHMMILKNFSEYKAICSKGSYQLDLLEGHTVWLEVCICYAHT